MLKTLQLSTVGRLSLALAVFLALLAAGALMAARSAGKRSAAPRLMGLAPDAAFAQGIVPPPPGQPTVAPSGIVVFGDGEATGAPDVAFLNLGVLTEGKTAREAMDQNATTMSAVIEAVKQAGIADTHLRTAGLSLNPIMSQPRPGDQAPPQVVGYRASNNVAVTVENTAKVGEVLDVAVAAGANVAGGVRFAIKDDSALRRRALEAAGQAAKAKAEALASSLGLRITGVQSVLEEGGPGPIMPQALSAAEAGRAAAPPIQPGELTLRTRVRAVFGYN